MEIDFASGLTMGIEVRVQESIRLREGGRNQDPHFPPPNQGAVS